MNARLAAIFIFSLLLANLAHAEWAETINVKVINTQSYPIAGEKVYINYQRQVSIDSSQSVAVTSGKGTTTANCAASPVTVSSVTINQQTGQAIVNTTSSQGNCQIGGGYIEKGNNTPDGLSPSALGVTGPWSVVITQKEVDLRRLDGLVLGVTNASGEFQIGLIDYVSFGEVREYLISSGKESRRVIVGEHYVGTKHVEVFVQNTSVTRITVQVADGDGRILPNVSIAGTCPTPFSGATDAQGAYSAYLRGADQCQLTARYGSIENTLFVSTPEGDVSTSLKLPLYDLSIKVVDDNNNPLRATVSVPGYPQGETDDSGLFAIKRFPASSANIGIIYNNRNQATPVELKSSAPMTIVFDVTPPRISDVNSTVNKTTGIGRVRARVVDGGSMRSEISSVSLRFSADKRHWSRVPMYPVTSSTYEANIPEQAPGTEVTYMIEASDAYANTQTSQQFSYTVPQAGSSGPISIPSAGSTNLFGMEISNLVLIAVGVLAAALLYRLKTQ
ncbi:MAG: hypothetical protein WC759_05505 [Candidatus Micrarchaeia archaeon]|jgi:hypothetical protein